MSERRSFPRVRASLDVAFAAKGVRCAGSTANLSLTGVLVLARDCPQAGEKLVLELTAPNGDVLDLRGSVVGWRLAEGGSAPGFAFVLDGYDAAYERLVFALSGPAPELSARKRTSEPARRAAPSPAPVPAPPAAEPPAAPFVSSPAAPAAAPAPVTPSVAPPAPATIAPAGPRADAVEMRVLLVSPSHSHATQIRDVAARAELVAVLLEVVSAAAEGLTALAAKRHDAALVAAELGGESGVDFVRRALAAGADAPLLLLADGGEPALEARAIRVGAADVLHAGRLEAAALERALLHAVERARAGAAHREARRELEELYERAPCGFQTLDESGVILRMNETALRWLGYEREELVGRRTFTHLLEPGCVPRFHERWRWFLDRGHVHDLDLELRRRDGTILPVSASASLVKKNGGPPTSRWTFVECGERHARDVALRRLAKAVDGMQLGVTIKDVFGTILYVNPAGAAMHGYAAAELVGRDANVLAPEELRRDRDEEPLAGSARWKRTSRNVRKDGSVFPVRLVSDVVTDEIGTPLAVVTCCEPVEASPADAAAGDASASAGPDPLEDTAASRRRIAEQLGAAEAAIRSLNALLDAGQK